MSPHTLPCLALAFCLTAVLAQDAPKPKDEPAAPAVDPEKAKTDPMLEQQQVKNLKTSKANLSAIGLAVHEYHDAMGRLPLDTADAKGKALLSWRVALLPYVGQKALYAEFKLEEPWDSEHNLKLVDKMPAVYRSPRVALKAKGNTVYQTFTGPNTVAGQKKPVAFRSIRDGTSNTLYAVETSDGVPWTKPGGVAFDRAKAVPEFGKAYGRMPLAVKLDGAPVLLDLKQVAAETLKNAIDPADGVPLGKDWQTGTDG